MSTKIVSEKQKDAFGKAATHPLQSWEWGEFRKAAGNEIIRLGVYKGNKLTDAVQIIIHSVPTLPYKIGTLIKGPKPTTELIRELKKIGKEEKLLFIKLEPNVVTKNKATKNQLIKLLRNHGCISGKTLFTPTTFWIGLTKSEDTLMKSFSSKTRYNIRLAERRGVKVVEDSTDAAFEKYIQLTKETVERQGFYAHTEKYHRLMWQYLNKEMKKQGNEEPIARLLVAKYKGEIITAWVVFVWHEFLYYPYGASSDKYKNVMANNLMMWEVIKYGKRLGLKTFDLWGREPGKGFTHFKEGYNPQVVEFLGTWDIKTSPLYWPYRFAEFLRWAALRTKSRFVKPKF